MTPKEQRMLKLYTWWTNDLGYEFIKLNGSNYLVGQPSQASSLFLQMEPFLETLGIKSKYIMEEVTQLIENGSNLSPEIRHWLMKQLQNHAKIPVREGIKQSQRLMASEELFIKNNGSSIVFDAQKCTIPVIIRVPQIEVPEAVKIKEMQNGIEYTDKQKRYLLVNVPCKKLYDALFMKKNKSLIHEVSTRFVGWNPALEMNRAQWNRTQASATILGSINAFKDKQKLLPKFPSLKNGTHDKKKEIKKNNRR